MNFDKLCMSCFREGGEELCKYCGYVEPTKRRSSLLPVRELLNGRYLIGEVTSVDKSFVEYKAWDTQENHIVEIQEYYPRGIAARDDNGTEIVVISQDDSESYQKNVRTIRANAEKMKNFADSRCIVNIFDTFECNNTVYIIKEYIEGMLLSDFIDSYGGKVDTETALSIIVPVLDGLSQIHKAGLVHRAISPKNIIITAENEIKISNFRFLKEASPYKDENMTIHFSVGFAPPEQYKTRSKQGAFSDIYSVGAVLYKMITGETPDDALERMTTDSLVPPKSLDPEIPDSISISIMKAMSMASELRFKSTADFKNCLLEKKEVVDVDRELKIIKTKNINKTTIALLIALVAVVGFIIYSLLK